MPTLKDLRAAAGLSQNELANASGVSIEAIKKIESGKVERPHPATLRLLAAVLGQVPVVMNGSRNGPVFDSGMFDNARRNQCPCLQIVPDPKRGVLDGFVPLRQTTLSGSIVGPLAQLRLVQVFGYTRAECDRVIEAIYRFPLPGDAAVTSVQVHFGDVTVQTNLSERAEAERQYASAREEGRQAALATRESADVLTLQLAGLHPDQGVTVETSFVQAAMVDGPGWQLRVPLTIGPRYTRPDEGGSAASRGQPLQIWRDPRHRFSLDLRVKRAASIASLSHSLTISPSDDDECQRVRLAEESVVPDRDLVLEWQPSRLASRPALDLVAHEDLAEGMRYFLALVTPPETTREWPGVDREVLLLVDRSGSMDGPKWEACRWAVRRFVAGLTPNDRFNLGLFESHCVWLEAAAVAGTDANRRRALDFLNRHAPTGGTELGPALEQALRSDASPGRRARHVLLVTDAQVSDEARILQLVEGAAERTDGRRVSVISIDSSPRGAFVRSLVESGGGEAAFLTSDPSEEDITTALDRVLDTWARPLATDLALTVETGAASVQARHAAGLTRSRFALGDLPAGRSLWVSGAVSLFSEPVVRLQAGSDVLAECALSLDGAPVCPEVKTLFGARQVARLERLSAEAQALDQDARDAILDELGYANDPLRKPRGRPVYAENARAEKSVVYKLLVRESLRFGLVCSATAFVGERLEAGRRVEASVQVPSALPYGWSEAFAAGAPPAVPTLARAITGASLRGRAMKAAPDRAMMPPAAAMAPQSESLELQLLESSAGFSTEPQLVLRYQGTPSGTERSLVLAHGASIGEAGVRLSRLRARITDPRGIDPSMEVWICLDDDRSTPLVRVKLAELLALGGERPLNLAVPAGTSVQVVLWLGDAAWPEAAGELDLEIK
jgi:Ca-activated chloride channel family protein